MEKFFNKESLMEASFSIFHKPITNNQPGDETNVFDLSDLIGSGFKETTDKLRSITDKSQNHTYKSRNFNYVTFSGVFKERKDASLIKHSNLICIDIDHVGEDLERIKSIINDDKDHIIMTFTSPNGDGLKAVYPIDSSLDSQVAWYRAYTVHISSICNLSTDLIDSSCSNVSRACFICHDPDVYINPEITMTSGVVPIKINTENPQISYESYTSETFELNFFSRNTDENFRELIRLTELKEGDYGSPRQPWIHKLACRCNVFGMDKNVCLEFILQYFEKHPESIREDKPIDVKAYLNNTVKDVYNRYERDFGQWPVPNNEINDQSISTPLISDEVYSNLPPLLREMSDRFLVERERDIFLIGVLGALSACFPKVTGIYDNRTVASNLFVFVTAPASAGKGSMRWAHDLTKGIHKHIKETNEIARKEYEFNKDNQDSFDQIEPPKQKGLFIPGNISSTAALQSISDNEGIGLIFETEADTLSTALGQDWGGFSDCLRKSFHHEPVSYRRRTASELVEIDRPHFSIVLSGTPGQVKTLIPNTENGLFSRFCFYSFDIESYWKDVFGRSFDGLEKYFHNKSELILSYFIKAWEKEEVSFTYSDSQKHIFNERFTTIHDNYSESTNDFLPTIRRLGLICFRISMLLSIIRIMEEEDLPENIICRDDDFNSALELVEVLKEHAKAIYLAQGKHKITNLKTNQQAFYKKLPSKFNRRVAMQAAESLNIKEKTAENYLDSFIREKVIQRSAHNNYDKI